jgi:hypothetical protein
MELFGSRTPVKDEQERRTNLGSAKYQETSGFLENFAEGFRLEFNDNNSIGMLINGETKVSQAQQIFEARNNGDIPDDVIEMYSNPTSSSTELDLDSLAKWLNKNRGTTIPTNEEVNSQLRTKLKNLHASAENTYSRATWWGKGGNILGSMASILVDPVYIPAMALGAGGAARGISVLAGRIAAEGVAWGASEAVKQQIVYDWKNSIGVQYSMDDALKNIAFAAVGGAAFQGVAEGAKTILSKIRANGLVKSLNKMSSRFRNSTNPTEREAARGIDTIVREAEKAPADKSALEVITTVEKTAKEQKDKPFKSVSDIIEQNKERKPVAEEVVEQYEKTKAKAQAPSEEGVKRFIPSEKTKAAATPKAEAKTTEVAPDSHYEQFDAPSATEVRDVAVDAPMGEKLKKIDELDNDVILAKDCL